MSSTDHETNLVSIKQRLIRESVADGGFVKSPGSREVDSALLGLAIPYRVVEPDDPRYQTTVARIERELMNGGGVHRYAADTYYGGGEWVLLTAWLAWHHRLLGSEERARELIEWVERQADEEGGLPEQVPANLNNPMYYPVWVDRWGPVAQPLLWSHAMYLIAQHA
jgi:GH15 family glucan-1,4-alpha-glucosidase